MKVLIFRKVCEELYEYYGIKRSEVRSKETLSFQWQVQEGEMRTVNNLTKRFIAERGGEQWLSLLDRCMV